MPDKGLILVTGSRYGIPWHELVTAFDAAEEHFAGRGISTMSLELVHGAAPGVDSAAGMLGKERGWEIKPFPAKEYGPWPQCGPIRNSAMVTYAVDSGKEVLVLAFPRGKADGTNNCKSKAIAAGLNVWTY